MKSALRFTLIMLALSSLFAAGCSLNPVTGKKELTLISADQEIAMGQQAGPQFEEEFGGTVDNTQLQNYVQNVGAKLASVSDREMPYEFALVASDVPNAFALPGGKIYISAGLFRHMNSERELAAVLGHEVVHVVARHSVQGLQREMGAEVFAELVGALVGGESGQTAQATVQFAAGMKNLQYSRGQESQSDAVGIKYLEKAGYNPWGMVELLETLQSLSQANPGLFGDLFATHPLTDKRIKEAREIINTDYSGYSPDEPDPNAQRFLRMRALLE